MNPYKKNCNKFEFQHLILVCLLILTPLPAFCDDAFMKVYGGGLKLYDGKSATIRMESETVKIELHKKTYTVDATFEFFNYGKTQAVKVGFPKSGYGNTAGFRGVINFISFETWVNGIKYHVKEIPGEMILDRKTKLDDKQKDEITKGEIGGGLEETRWLVKDVTFKGNEKTITRVRYTVPYGGIGRHESIGEYLYGTGKSWKGTIGNARFIFMESSEVSLLDVVFAEGGYFENKRKYKFKRLGGYIYEYTLEDFEPKENENLKFFITLNSEIWELTPEYSQKVIERENLEHFSLWQLRILRNAIYAFHGKIFKDPELDKYFRKYAWYKPRQDFKESADLNKTEKDNIAAIAAYENELMATLRSK